MAYKTHDYNGSKTAATGAFRTLPMVALHGSPAPLTIVPASRLI
jgi:hypothetical protein